MIKHSKGIMIIWSQNTRRSQNRTMMSPTTGIDSQAPSQSPKGPGNVTISAQYRHWFRLFYLSTVFLPIFNNITKTGLCNFEPPPPPAPKPQFYIVKLRFTGIYIIVLISAQNIDCEYSLEPPRRGAVLTSTHNLCFWAEVWKIAEFFYLKIFILMNWAY